MWCVCHDGVDLLVASRDHDHRRVVNRTNLSAHINTGHARQHHVEQNDGRAMGPPYLESLLPVGSEVHDKSLSLQRLAQSFAKGRLVIDHQDAQQVVHESDSRVAAVRW